jgi:hypothetical protein
MAAEEGAQYTYEPGHGKGFGENALGAPLSAEMSELDLTPGTLVTVLELDKGEGETAGWPLVQWVDAKGLDRITTVEPSEFDADFQPA